MYVLTESEIQVVSDNEGEVKRRKDEMVLSQFIRVGHTASAMGHS
jgi:hypothetical protein